MTELPEATTLALDRMCLLMENPIEEAISKIKGLLRRAGARTREALVKAIVESLGAVTARDAQGFLDHCGYRLAAQLP